MERLLGALHEHRHVDARRGFVRECGEVVVGKQFGMVLRSTQRVDPLGRAPVSLGPRRSGDLLVRDFPEKLVAERVFDVSRDR